MRLRNLKKAETRARYLSNLRKKLWVGSKGHDDTAPIFIVGLQRSGTTMLMNVFHLHPDIEVYDESPNSKIFIDFRVRNLQIVEQSIKSSRFPFVCYKIISDSHILNKFIELFPSAKIVWMYRDAADNAESQIRQFTNAGQAVRLVAQGLPGGGWFAEGVSPAVAMPLRELALTDLTDFDYACLTWWARNSLFFELGLDSKSNVRILQYEELVRNPRIVMSQLFDWIGLQWKESAFRFVHARSVGKKNLPTIDPKVELLCNELKKKLDETMINNWL